MTMGSAQMEVDSARRIQLHELVVTASRIKEDLNKSPISIERMDYLKIKHSSSPSFYDAIDHIRGVQMIIPSLGFKVINTRGFANTTNVRFVQLVDGVDNQAPHLGAPIANALGPSDLDIESVEIVPGVASALYGMNAINGLANFTTRDPFLHQGLTVQQKIGMNRVGSPYGTKPFYETSLRWAKSVTAKIAFKINGTFLIGTDWVADNPNDLNAQANASTGLLGPSNPALDPVNSYGNESPNRRTILLNGINYVIARTGYFENQVIDYNIKNIKGDGTFIYAFRPDTRLSYTFRLADINNVYQRANRFSLNNYILQQHTLSFQSKSIQVKTYLNMENTGDSYNARSMAENIDKSFKSDDQWFSEYSGNFRNEVQGGVSIAEAHRLARQTADTGRPEPNTERFNILENQLKNINNWDYGAALRVRSRMFHAEAQYNLTEGLLKSLRSKIKTDLLVGMDHRAYIIIPDGNYFINPTHSGQNLSYGKTGAFLQASRYLFSERVKIGTTLRADKNEFFPVKWNPRFTMVYSPSPLHNFRFSAQGGYRFPSVFEAFSNVNSGGVKRVGGLPVMSNGIFENSYNRASIDFFQSAINKDVNTSGLTKNEAIVKNQSLLVKNDYTYIRPEHIRSLEFGYRGLFFHDDLKVDVDFYYNQYTSFIAQVEVNIPKSSNTDSIAFYLSDKTRQDRYRMWTNSKTVTYNYGSSASVQYPFYRSFVLTGNISYARLERKSTNDGLEDGFNTPKFITNLSVGNPEFYKKIGFMFTYRWQSTYHWQSFLVNGDVPAYHTIDAQISWEKNNIRIKLGGTNILNQYYFSYLGGPSVGGFYYTAVVMSIP